MFGVLAASGMILSVMRLLAETATLLVTGTSKSFKFSYCRVVKSDNLQYNMLGRWVDCLIDQASDGPSIILID